MQSTTESRQGRDEAPKSYDDARYAGDAGRASILMVDDAPANLLALEAVLSPLRHRLVTATNGKDALRRMMDEEFCLVLIDVQMVGMDGFETAARIRSHPRIAQTPLIFLTAVSDEPRHMIRGYAQGAVDYLVKPFDPDILRSKAKVFADLYLRGKKLQEQDRMLRQQEIAAVQRRSEERYRGLAESVPVIVWATGPRGNVVYSNRSWTMYSGCPSERGLEVADARYLHAEDVGRVRRSWGESLARGTQWEDEFRLRRIDGEYRWHLGRALPQTSGKGLIEGWIVTATDIDERKRSDDLRARVLEKEQRARETAEAANRAKDEFLATVSHELRAPLNAIIGWVQMLRSDMLDVRRREHALETIERNAMLQRSLVEDILDVSRIIAGKIAFDPETLRLGAVVDAAIEATRPMAREKDIAIERGGWSERDVVVGDSRRLQQAVGNLLSNAVKFTSEGGKVTVTMTRDETQIAVRVADTGVGIEKEFLPYVFDRFRQADGSTTRAYGGLGLGLAIVRHITELHGGSVRADSEGPGSGACFTLELPAEPEPSERRLATVRSVHGGEDLSGLRVLFVDDEADARELAVEFLRRCGAVVTTAASSPEALARIKEARPDVLVSDIGMPKEDGLTMIRRIRELPDDEGGRVPAVAVSGLASDEDAKRAVAAGFQEHLPKPLELAKLLETLFRLGHQRPGREDDREPGGR